MSRAARLALCLALAGQALPLVAQAPAPSSSPSAARTRSTIVNDGVRDFDFLHGVWRIHNRKLRDPLTGSSEWYEFEGRSIERPLWDGQGNLEEYEATLPDGTRLRGLALRLYDPRARRWTIHWSNSVNGTLDPPMIGTFQAGRGEFLGYEDYRGRMILVRFYWTSKGPDSARWEQAFSADGGRTWETNWIMEFTRTDDASVASAAAEPCCPVVELRRYALHPGARDKLIELFDREFVEGQEATGMEVIGQFRDLDRPDAFVWLRGFRDMPARAASLGAFYGGPVWAAHRDAANSTMVSTDDVRLLRPARSGAGFKVAPGRPPPGATVIPRGLVVATVYTLHPPAAPGFADFFDRRLAPVLAARGAKPVAVFETEPAPNNFPQLPVREGERAFVWFARFADVRAYERSVAALAADRRWAEEVRPALDGMLRVPAEVWRLTPTARSRMPQ